MGLFREFHGMQPIFNGKLYSIHLRYLDSMWLNAVFYVPWDFMEIE